MWPVGINANFCISRWPILSIAIWQVVTESIRDLVAQHVSHKRFTRIRDKEIVPYVKNIVGTIVCEYACQQCM